MEVKQRLPDWLRRPIQTDASYVKVHQLLKQCNLHTVCEDAKCPNRHECWNQGTATFMILGNVCTRNCRFCNVLTGRPGPVDLGEPERVALASEKMGLRHVVVTSVTRDDLSDGGSEMFVKTILAIRRRLPMASVEVLTPDFKGDRNDLYQVLDAGPTVFNHNIETVERLQKPIRQMATYECSLNVLKWASEYGKKIKIKSGIMVGLGETDDEVIQTLKDLFENGVRLLTIGQYLAPSREHVRTKRFVTPQEFLDLEKQAYALGFESVAAGPLVRSSYHAQQMVSE